MQQQELIPQLFKSEYRKIISVLCKLFGTAHIALAEDITHDTFLLASETWGLKGIPQNPTAWLYTVAKNKTIDHFRRNKLFSEKIREELKGTQTVSEEMEIDLSVENISDSQLKMMFVICNPLIPVEAQIGLALRILCGFGIDEIADAFLSNKETINKRLFRAKEKLREENIKVELPPANEINSRLENVLTTLYLLFNEGYHSTTQTTSIRKDLCLEAMRLCYLLLEHPKTNTPPVNALMSLMCFHSSRFEARLGQSGESILYDQQDRSLWDSDLIAQGNYFLIESAKGNEISKYHLEASIAYWHATPQENSDRWKNILELYNKLVLIDPSPMVALNRAYVLSKAKGKELAIKEAEKIGLSNNHFYYGLLGNLYTNLNNKKAADYYKEAIKYCKSPNDKLIFEQHLQALTH
ncbi:RNA polymerase subunit sigma [Sphingobacteriaceae bacterium]|nr:RNA polymerase subunit sigma [Sphingobacteriaceae bacterium]